MQAGIAYANGRKDDARELRVKADEIENAAARERLAADDAKLAWIERENMQYWQRP